MTDEQKDKIAGSFVLAGIFGGIMGMIIGIVIGVML